MSTTTSSKRARDTHDDGIEYVRVIKRARVEESVPAPRYRIREAVKDSATIWWLFSCTDRHHNTYQHLFDPESVPDVKERDAMVQLIRENPSLFVAIGEALDGRLEQRDDWDDIGAREILCGDWAWSPFDEIAHVRAKSPSPVVQLSNFIHVVYDGSFC